MRCPKDKRLQAYIDGELAGPDAAELERHLDACPACREKLAQLRTAGEDVKAKISSLDPVHIPAPPNLRLERPGRPVRTRPFWRGLAASSIRVPAAAAVMAGLFVFGVALGTVLKGLPGAKERPRFERPAGVAGPVPQGAVSIEVSSLGLNLEEYRPIAQPEVFTIKE